MENLKERALKVHDKGKISINVDAKVETMDDLSLVYTPGVAEVCKVIAEDKKLAYDYTIKSHSLAVVTDGSAVLGLKNIGAEASLPVMEGKCALFKKLADIDAFPIAIKTQDVDTIVNTVKNIAPVFGAVNLEDIAAPRCFEIEDQLQDIGIPVVHDDQHGTAIVILGALVNAAKVVGKPFNELKVVLNGGGAAGIAVSKLLMCCGIDKNVCTAVKELVVCDTKGAIYDGREGLNPFKQEVAELTNPEKKKGLLADVIQGADVFLGLSGPNVLTREMVQTMNKDPIVFAMANPTPEIMPDEIKDIVGVVGTGRSDFPNQINNSLAFPGLFRGALDAHAVKVTNEMKIAAAHALADYVKNPTKDEILPLTLDKAVATAVAKAVEEKAREQGLAQDK